MAKALLMAKEKMDHQEKQLALANKQLSYQAPIVQYANNVLSSTSVHTSTTIASELNMSSITLNKLLVKARFLRKTGKKGEYSLYANYQGQGFVTPKTHTYERTDGSTVSTITLEFTEKGRMKIHSIYSRAINAGVLEERKGRYFINNDWVESTNQKTA